MIKEKLNDNQSTLVMYTDYGSIATYAEIHDMSFEEAYWDLVSKGEIIPQ